MLLACQSYKETNSTHTDWLLDLYASNIKTLQKLPNIFKELPEKLKVCPEVHSETLLVTLKMRYQSVTIFMMMPQNTGQLSKPAQPALSFIMDFIAY